MAAPVTTLAPAVAALALMLLTLASGLDFRLADQLYAWQGGAWSLRHDFLVSKILHAKAQKLSIAIELSMVGLALASHWHPRLRRWRRGLSCVAVTGLAGLALVSLGKHALPMSTTARVGTSDATCCATIPPNEAPPTMQGPSRRSCSAYAPQ